MVGVLRVRPVIVCKKRPTQIGKTQIRLLLKKQSDQGLPCLLFSVLTRNLLIPSLKSERVVQFHYYYIIINQINDEKQCGS